MTACGRHGRSDLGMKTVKLVTKYGLVAFFVAGGVNHFLNTDFYLSLMPDYIPAHAFMVYLSGVTEVVAGIMLAIPGLSRWGAWFIIAHLVAFFTVHFWMIQESERYIDETVTIASLWLRVVLQVVFIVWAYWYTTDRGVPKALH